MNSKRNPLKDRDFQAGAIVLIFAIAGYVYTQMTVSTSNALVASGIAADFYPKLLFLVLGACGVILMVQSARRLPEEQVPFPRTDWKRLLISFFLMLAYAFLLDEKLLGFIIASILFMFVFMLFLGERKWRNLILVPVVGTFAIWLLFGKVFMIALPTKFL